MYVCVQIYEGRYIKAFRYELARCSTGTAVQVQVPSTDARYAPSQFRMNMNSTQLYWNCSSASMAVMLAAAVVVGL